MDMEARSLAPDDKQPLLLKLRTYKSELSGMKKAAKEAASAGGGAHTRMTHTRAHAEKMLVSLLLFCSAFVIPDGGRGRRVTSVKSSASSCKQ